jgi:hypothetical protein
VFAKPLFYKGIFSQTPLMLPADSVRGHGGQTIGRIQSLLDGVDRGTERLRDDLSESSFVQGRNVNAGGGDHFRLVNRDLSDREAPDYSPVAVDEARGPSLIVVRPRRYRLSVLKNFAELLTVRNPGQELGHCRGVVEPRRRK